MRICIIGSGHIGTTLACYFKHYNSRAHVSLYTRHPERFTGTIKCNDIEKKISYIEHIDCVSNDPYKVGKDADIVFIALPHFAVEKAFQDIAPYVSQKAFIGVLPGGGGCEFFFNKYFDRDKTLFGFQRVPFTAKLVDYGKETNLKSWKPYSVVGTQRSDRIDTTCEIIEKCGLKTKPANNYLSIALTPTNPILHTSRTYDIFRNYDRDHVFDDRFKYYVGWTDHASETMLTMDEELHTLLNNISEIDTSIILPLTEHYEAPTIKAMTEKINSIQTFQSVYAPLVQVDNGNGFVADTTSRMFTEDFPWGLAIFRSYFEIIGIKAHMMDIVLSWYAKYMGYDWYIDGKFCGKDLKNTGILQNYGIETKKQLLMFY